MNYGPSYGKAGTCRIAGLVSQRPASQARSSIGHAYYTLISPVLSKMTLRLKNNSISCTIT